MSDTAQGAPAPSVDRETANRLNPLISSFFTEDTLNDVVSMVSDMGYLLSFVARSPKGTEPQFGSLYLFCNVIAAALSYESENPRLAVQDSRSKGSINE